MATNGLAERSRGQSIGSEAESTSGTRQFPPVNTKPQAPGVEDSRSAFRGRKDSSRSRNQNIFSRSRSRGRAEEKRPGTGGQISRSKSRSRREAGGPKGLLGRSRSRRSSSKLEEVAEDLADLPPPQLTRLDCTNAQSEASMIGVAVGSPSQLQPTHLGSLGQSPLAKMETELSNSSEHHFEDPTSKTKGARWKKLGGLFKARNAFLNEPVPSPFYQLQVQYAAQEVKQSESSFQSRSVDPAPRDQDARFLFDKILGSNGQLDPQNYVENPHQQILVARGRTEESSKPSDHTGAQRPSKQYSFPSRLPLLDVQIPDVQMDRYSVMFGSLLDEQESPNLLSRRDKTLDKLLTISDEDEEPSEGANVQKQDAERPKPTANSKDQSYLMPDGHTIYPRRATSPTPSKSPSFSLFPHLPQAPEKIVVPIPLGKQSPLQRSFTAPARLSPMQETFNFDEVQPSKAGDLKTNNTTVTNLPQTASTFESKRESSNPSIQSPTSTRSSVNEYVLLDIKSSGMLKRRQDQHEIMDDQDLKVAPLKARHVAKDARGEPLKSQKVEPETQNLNRTGIHEETLAALERPSSLASKSKNASSSLKSSKARIDEIMRGPPPDQQPEPPISALNGQTSPEKPLPKGVREVPQETGIARPQPPELASDTPGLAISAVPAAALAKKEPKPAVMSQEREISSVTSHTCPKNECGPQPTQQSTRAPQQPPPNSSNATNAPARLPPKTTNPSAEDNQNTTNYRIRQPLQSSQTGKRRPPQSNHAQAQSRPSAANISHRLHPRANAPPPGRPPFNANNQSFPTYRPPPPSFTMRPQPPFDHMHPLTRPNARAAATTPIEKDQDNILDYYLDDAGADSSSQKAKSPKKLQKQPSNKEKRRLSLSSKHLPYPKSDSKPSQSSNPTPRSPVPISKYSANAVTLRTPVICPPMMSSTYKHHPSLSRSSIYSDRDLVDPRLLSPAVRAAREKAAQCIQSTSVQDLSLKRTRSTSISSPPRRPPRADFRFIVDEPHTTTGNETSFYSHSNASTPSPPNSNSRPQTPSERFRFNVPEQGGKPPVPKRSPSRGTSLSSLPPGAGGVESRSTTPKPAPPARSASAGTVGAGAGGGGSGIQGHLKPEKGEKVVERQAGLVPTIVDAEKGHRTGRSVNLVIESI